MSLSVRRNYRLNVGGQATLWDASRVDNGAPVVVKELLHGPDASRHDDEEKRFRREVRCQMMLRHEGIIPIIGAELEESKPWYVMPRAERSLLDSLQPPKKFGQDAILAMMVDVIEAIEFAHSEGVIHRDLKPGNILRYNDRWVVADFGMCVDKFSNSTTLTQSNFGLGTIQYMAPEQFDSAHDVTETADIYSLGKVFYHCLTGDVPFPTIKLAKVPAKFRYVVGRCVEEEPSDRYQTLSEMRKELHLLILSETEFAPPSARGKELISKYLNDGSLTALKELMRLLVERGDDEVFYREFVPVMTPQVLASLHKMSESQFNEIVRQFNYYADGPHPFSYTDTIADFFHNILKISANESIRRLALERILIVGAYHNRFYVREVFVKVVSGFSDPNDVLMAANLLQNNPAEAQFMASGLSQVVLPQQIRSVLRAVS